jgi:transglutaminase-like putative cysteine protease
MSPQELTVYQSLLYTQSMDRVPARVRDFSSAALLLLILLVASQRLYSTNWTPGLGTVLLLTLLGGLLGLLLGFSKFNRGVTFFLGLGYSAIFIPLVTLWNLFKGIAWSERMSSLVAQLADSFVQLISNQPVRDSTLFIVFASIVFWIISVTAGYTLIRSGGFAGAVLPAGIVLVLVQLFDMKTGDQVYVLAVFVFLCLLLLGRLTLIRRRLQWKNDHVWVSAESATDLNIIFGVTALLLVVLVWGAPASAHPVTSARIAWENLTRPWRERQEELNRSVESLQSDQVQTVEFYGDTLALGGQAETGSDAYLNIRVPLLNGADRYYWRVRTYDLYQNGQWITNYSFDEPFTPDQRSLSLADPQGLTGEFVFTVPGGNLAALVTPSRPVWINRAVQLTFTPAPDGRLDPLMFQATPPILAGGEYIVHANIYQPTITQLVSAGTVYPGWVTDHYLQLPVDLPPEIGNLARQITVGAATPYDKAAAITNYLRTNITYSPTVELPPAGRDPLVWFLFDTKKGFCNYYASAEVILLRSLGMPARMVVGFAQGEYLPPNQYIIYPRDAHAWPEVYFPGIGWVEFEPTTSQPPLVRPSGGPLAGAVLTPTPQTTPHTNAAQTPNPLDGNNAGSGSGPQMSSLVRVMVIFLTLCVLLIAGFVAYFFGALDRAIEALRRIFKNPLPVILKMLLENLSLTAPDWLARWAYLTGLTPMERSFSVVYRSLRWLRLGVSPAQTPAEAAELLSKYVPGVNESIQSLLQECQQSLYGLKSGDLILARRAADVIRRASARAALQRRWDEFGGILKRGFQRKTNP